MKVISTEGNQNRMSESWPSKGKCLLFYFHFPRDNQDTILTQSS